MPKPQFRNVLGGVWGVWEAKPPKKPAAGAEKFGVLVIPPLLNRV